MGAVANEIGFDSFVKPFQVAVMKYKYEDGNAMNKDELKQLIDNMRASVEGRINACFWTAREGRAHRQSGRTIRGAGTAVCRAGDGRALCGH